MAVVLRPLGPSRVVAGLGNIYGKAMDRARLSPRRSERFQAKWKPVRVKKTRQTKNLEPRFDSIEAEKAPAAMQGCSSVARRRKSRKRPCAWRLAGPMTRPCLWCEPGSPR